jgi:NADH:ubiquinone oxidoreductase subunit 6 (subunit J)
MLLQGPCPPRFSETGLNELENMTLFLQITDPGRGDTLLGLLRTSWPIVATALVGCAGIYGLLPQARRSKPIWGGLLTALALLGGALWLIHFEGVWPERVLFYSFSLLAIAGGIMMLAQTNPVHAALSFALVVLSTAGLFLLLAAPFLMAATLIIYAGAIVVTFLFVIMLAQQAGLTSADARSREPFLASLAGFVLLGSLWCVLDRTYNIESLVGQLEQVGRAETLEEVASIWGGPDQAKSKTLPAVEELRRHFPEEMVFNLEHAWSRKNLADLKKYAQALVARAQEQRHRLGTLSVPGKELPKVTALPAQNVAAVGQTLFTDYLVPVLLAGVLLLVATIGAIVIAGRRGEVLR